jgi:hypothetical protein
VQDSEWLCLILVVDVFWIIGYNYKMLVLLLHWNLMYKRTNVLMFQGPVGLLSAARIDAVVTVLMS